MIGALFDLEDFRNRESRSLSNFSGVFFWDLAALSHRFAGEDFNLEPDLKFARVRPELAHLRPGITIDHRENIKARFRRGKCFMR
jgi:hypothetical protein